MKSFYKVFGIGILALTLGWGFATAGINPANPGLPWVVSANMASGEGYASGLDNATNNAGSIMCVDCHGRNPSNKLTGDSADQWGTHWVTSDFQDTSSHGGYPGGGGAATVGKYMHAGPWSGSASTALVSSGSSKYGDRTGNAISSVTPGAGTFDNTYQMICESCHSIVNNVGPKKLLAAAGANLDNTAGAFLCVGCHGDMQNDFNNEPLYFSAAGVQDHHVNVMTGEVATYYEGAVTPTTSDRDMGRIDNTYYVAKRMWAFSRGTAGGLPRNIECATANTPGTVCGNNGDIGSFTAANFNCNFCHRPHSAVSSTGALILQSGITGNYTFGLLSSSPANGNAPMVLQRTQGNPSDVANKLVQDDAGLCAGCHPSYR